MTRTATTLTALALALLTTACTEPLESDTYAAMQEGELTLLTGTVVAVHDTSGLHGADVCLDAAGDMSCVRTDEAGNYNMWVHADRLDRMKSLIVQRKGYRDLRVPAEAVLAVTWLRVPLMPYGAAAAMPEPTDCPTPGVDLDTAGCLGALPSTEPVVVELGDGYEALLQPTAGSDTLAGLSDRIVDPTELLAVPVQAM